MFKIQILDTIECTCDPALANIIRPCLSYPAVFYKQGMYRKIRTEYEKSTMTKAGDVYFFFTGLLPRVLNFCKENNIPVNVEGKLEKIPFSEPKLKNLSLRKEQIRLVTNALEKQRGVLIAPTGTGKTLIALAVISSFMDKDTNVLWLCHTKDLMYQAGREAEKELGVEVGYIGDGNNDHDFKVTMATRQSFIKVAPELGWKYDVVVIDEVHHMAKFDSNYAELMRSVLSPVRIGLTATIPKDKQAVLAIEAFLGPVIEEITVKEGQERGTMAEIKMKFLKVPLSHSIRDLRKYQDVYDAGVVNRREQHELIARTCKQHVREGDAILILVTRIQHGENILAELKRQGVKAYFAQGNTESSVRNDLKDALNNKDIHCLIATTIFQEGINIPELNVLINAAGGKSEIRTIQAIGRGLRVTDTKKVLTCYDIMSLDHPYLISHLAERLAVYSEMRWLE